jgi:SM-20-related protein
MIRPQQQVDVRYYTSLPLTEYAKIFNCRPKAANWDFSSSSPCLHVKYGDRSETLAAQPAILTKPERNRDLQDRFTWSAAKRCPYGTLHDALGAATVSALLDYVGARQTEFRPGLVRSRRTGEHGPNPSLRDSLFMPNLGPFKPQIESVMHAIAPVALAQFGLIEPAVEPREFEFACYGDGGYFRMHVDTTDRLDRIRILSCVYYFAATPPRFSGGELRLRGFPDPSHGAAGPVVDITPETDMLVIFPSWLEHEVLPVHVPSKAWRDGRFSINCWIHRASASA